jgi:galactokinase
MSPMLSGGEWLDMLQAADLDGALADLYGEGELNMQRARYAGLIRAMRQDFNQKEMALISAPGRCELGGNHTDHNRGRVLAAAIHLDCLAAASKREDLSIRIRSGQHPDLIRVDLNRLDPVESEQHTPHALVRGVAAGFKKSNCRISGFDAWVDSRVLVGGGLSSSAAFEVLVGGIFNHLFNQGRMDYLTLAGLGTEAENRFFGKPCGRMDQIASAAGGFSAIDFKCLERPVVRRLSFSFKKQGYCLCVVNTGGSHADLTPEYAAIREEMNQGAKLLGRPAAQGIGMAEVIDNLPRLRKEAGDRAVLRLIHFIKEDQRAADQAKALSQGNLADFFCLVNRSGDSSWRLLQNCYSLRNPHEQPIPLALSLTRDFLAGDGACRIQGGGFAGTIQAYIPLHSLEDYTRLMEPVFGKGSVIPLRIRPQKGGIPVCPKKTGPGGTSALPRAGR